MTQTSNRIFDEMARLMNDAAGVAQGVRREFDTLFRAQAERILRDLDVVQREEFEAVKEMARLASSPADLWQGILAGNVDNVTIALRHVMDRLPVGDGKPGATTRRLQTAYEAVVRGTTDAHPEWRTAV